MEGSTTYTYKSCCQLGQLWIFCSFVLQPTPGSWHLRGSAAPCSSHTFPTSSQDCGACLWLQVDLEVVAETDSHWDWLTLGVFDAEVEVPGVQVLLMGTNMDLTGC
ncbi:unnamed protein product [Ixodes persulcatus]